LDHGIVRAVGPTKGVLNAYSRFLAEEEKKQQAVQSSPPATL